MREKEEEKACLLYPDYIVVLLYNNAILPFGFATSIFG